MRNTLSGSLCRFVWTTSKPWEKYMLQIYFKINYFKLVSHSWPAKNVLQVWFTSKRLYFSSNHVTSRLSITDVALMSELMSQSTWASKLCSGPDFVHRIRPCTADFWKYPSSRRRLLDFLLIAKEKKKIFKYIPYSHSRTVKIYWILIRETNPLKQDKFSSFAYCKFQ